MVDPAVCLLSSNLQQTVQMCALFVDAVELKMNMCDVTVYIEVMPRALLLYLENWK